MSSVKKNKPSQIPLDLKLDSQVGRDDLIESPANSLALSAIDSWPDWPGRIMVIAGPVGSGKTHLALSWAAASATRVCPAETLKEHISDLVELASSGGSLVLEDLGEAPIDQNALFHLVNAINQGNGYCLITSRQWPGAWKVDLPDLKSRIGAFQIAELKEPDDALLKQVMVKLFADRQMIVNDGVVEYCAIRMERSLQSAGILVDTIDRLSLAGKSPVSRSVAAKALAMIESGSQ